MIKQKINKVKHIIPHYWPIKTFIHHNPLIAFEKLKFNEAVEKAKEIFESKVYMDCQYYIDLYMSGNIREDIFEKNLNEFLEKYNYERYFYEAKQFLIEISPLWEKYKYLEPKTSDGKDFLKNCLFDQLREKDNEEFLQDLTKNMTFYEIHDALFDTNLKELIEKEIIEYISRFLDEGQTTVSMYQRNLGMFNTFKYFEGVNISEDAEEFIEKSLDKLKVKDKERYVLNHLLKQAGWVGFISYREEDELYPFQQEYPASTIDYLAVRLFYEDKYVSTQKINNFEKLHEYLNKNLSLSILKLLKYRGILLPKYIDLLESGKDPEYILKIYKDEQVDLKLNQILNIRQIISRFDKGIVDFAKFIYLLKENEGYIWLKSLEDSYIHFYVTEFKSNLKPIKKSYLAASVFCIDVRSEAIRRYIEKIGPYSTYGAAGFFGVPITFIEFDKGNEQFLCPAIVKPTNVIFELPKKGYEEYKTKKKTFKVIKSVLNDLKNNPYTPFIMVEAVGWLFGINLFGKTLAPLKMERFFSKFRPQKPKTVYSLDKLSEEEISEFAMKIHLKIIDEVLTLNLKRAISDEEMINVWRHTIFDEPLNVKDADNNLIELLKIKYNITKEDYEEQKAKLRQVGFTLEEKVRFVKNFLSSIGLTKEFPKFVFVFGHGSKSDNNPFESALDCGACGGNVGIVNARVISMIANDEKVREKLREEGIDIPEYTKFIPGMHNTTTDEIELEDTEILNEYEKKLLEKIKEDFDKASSKSRLERAKTLPNAKAEEDIFTKSCDWSEPRPEWGLSKNMAFYIGKRETTKNIPLFNRFFLHSYNWEEDINGDILANIFSGPLVVAEWINMEHYFSTVDNEVYGAGSKVYHNIVSKIGVFFGNYSDLRIGLPEQTVNLEDKAYHEPIRLITFVEAPLEIVKKTMQKSALSNPLIKNEWVRLIVVDEKDKKIYLYENEDFKIVADL